MHDIPNRPPRVGAQILNMISVRFDGFSAPPAGAEQAIQTLCLTHTHYLAAGSQTAVFVSLCPGKQHQQLGIQRKQGRGENMR